MADAGDWDAQPCEDFDGVGAASDLRFDARGREQEIHDDPSFGAAGGDEAGRREALDAILLDRRQDPEAARLQIEHERLRVGVVAHIDDDIHVPRRPWLGACAHGESAHECPSTPSGVQLARDAP
jgi:hypothetical protein